METSLEKIDLLRQRLGVPQVELCRKADVCPSTLSRARSSGRQPSGRILRKLGGALTDIARERGVAVVEEAGR